MQTVVFIQLLGWILLIAGIIMVILAVISYTQDSETVRRDKVESKGVILLGPIPIVWGYGKRGWLIAGCICIILFLIWWIMIL